MRHLGVSGPTLVVGHSYGGVLALLHAALYPNEIIGLVLVDPMNPGFVDAVGIDWLPLPRRELRSAPKSLLAHVREVHLPEQLIETWVVTNRVPKTKGGCRNQH